MAINNEPPVQLHPDLNYRDLVAFVNENFRKVSSVTTLINTIYPVGAIYTSTESTNPGDLFGVGTWEAFGAGRVLVGKATSGTFATAGATGGAETHTLTTTEIPSHTHTSQQTYKLGDGTAGRSGEGITGNSAGTAAEAYNAVPQINTGSTGGGGSHNNLQPYIVVYMFKRTA